MYPKSQLSLLTQCHTHFPLHHFTIQFYQLAYFSICFLFLKNKVLVDLRSYQSQNHAFCVSVSILAMCNSLRDLFIAVAGPCVCETVYL